VIGICIRDETDSFLSAKTEWFKPIWDVHVDEALRLLTALKWVHELILRPDFELHAKRWWVASHPLNMISQSLGWLLKSVRLFLHSVM
jgi:hypothetical protein